MPTPPPFSAEQPDINPGDTGKFVEGFAVATYWDGLEPGADAPLAPNAPEDERSKRQALKAIAAYTLSDKPFPPIPTQSFLPGQEFDPASHPPGTLFWAYEEMLVAPVDKLPIQLDEPAPMTHTPTVRPVVVRLGVPNEWMYSGQPLWIATGEGRRGLRRSYAATIGELAMTPDGLIQRSTVEPRPDGPIAIGAVQQENRTIEGRPFATLRRTLIVHRCNNVIKSDRPSGKWRWPSGWLGVLQRPAAQRGEA